MEWFEKFREEMNVVFAQAEQIVARFPPPYHQSGQHYLDQFTVLKETSSKNYICYLLPYWLQNLTGLDTGINRRLALGSVFGMLYYFIIDDLMDSPTPDCREKLPLGHLFHYEFLSIFRELFPAADSPLWHAYRTFDAQWAEALVREKDSLAMQDKPLALAHKAAPVKLTATAALLLANRPELQGELNASIDRVLVTLQLADDWTDWEADLLEGNYNALLALASPSLAAIHSLSADNIRKLIYDGDLADRYVRLAQEYRMQAAETLSLPDLQAFHDFLIDSMDRDATRIREAQDSLTAGGLFYYLSKNLQNR
ncbi:hypothetical protein WMW72_09535 [Paenibacillus filicis]|uniref:Uncharacterized protein n=1 Tax=Paenibacillus filicis TaxID=669464 RepID=A0ABU9DK69_9BACL